MAGASKKPRIRDAAATEEQQQPPRDHPARFLPDGVLEEVLARAAPRGLAACRCACRAWRAVVDARRLLRSDLLPLSVGGIFIGFHGHDLPPRFLARPSTTGRAIPRSHGCLPGMESWGEVVDHCNGLLLLHDSVVNPAARWWAPLPQRTHEPVETMRHDYDGNYLVYDPTMSPHYEVFVVPCIYEGITLDGLGDKRNPVIEQSEWLPSPCIMHVFSSRTGRWEKRSFVREGDAVSTIADVRLVCPSQNPHRYAIYWRGALYVHCQTNFIMRISLSNDKYHVIKLPTSVNNDQYFRIGRSRKGVYFASLDPQCWLQVWRLKESRADEMEWVLIHYRDLKRMVPRRNDDQQVHRPWILQDEVYPNENKEVMSDEEIAWNSDDDNVLSNEDKVGEYGRRYMSVLGFHPYKEVVFLSESSKRVMAYHLYGSKVEYLGNLNPAEYDVFGRGLPHIHNSFPYTPSWM